MHPMWFVVAFLHFLVPCDSAAQHASVTPSYGPYNCDGQEFFSCPVASGTCYTASGYIGCCTASSCAPRTQCYSYNPTSSASCDINTGGCTACTDPANGACVVISNVFEQQNILYCGSTATTQFTSYTNLVSTSSSTTSSSSFTSSTTQEPGASLTAPTSQPTAPTATSSPSNHTSDGEIAGVATGGAVGALAILALMFFLFRRFRRRQAAAQTDDSFQKGLYDNGAGMSSAREGSQAFAFSEVEGSSPSSFHQTPSATNDSRWHSPRSVLSPLLSPSAVISPLITGEARSMDALQQEQEESNGQAQPLLHHELELHPPRPATQYLPYRRGVTQISSRPEDADAVAGTHTVPNYPLPQTSHNRTTSEVSATGYAHYSYLSPETALSMGYTDNRPVLGPENRPENARNPDVENAGLGINVDPKN